MACFLGDFKGQDGVFEAFGVEPSGQDGICILAAWYGYGCYDGSAAVLFEKDGQLYEVYGSHCSCYGLEGQWSPELVVESELLARALREAGEKSGWYGDEEKVYWLAVTQILSDRRSTGA